MCLVFVPCTKCINQKWYLIVRQLVNTLIISNQYISSWFAACCRIFLQYSDRHFSLLQNITFFNGLDYQSTKVTTNKAHHKGSCFIVKDILSFWALTRLVSCSLLASDKTVFTMYYCFNMYDAILTKGLSVRIKGVLTLSVYLMWLHSWFIFLVLAVSVPPPSKHITDQIR